MKYGKIICDPTSEEAKALIGKGVMADNSFYNINEYPESMIYGILSGINKEGDNPFIVKIYDEDGDYDAYDYTFIRECIEREAIKGKPKYVPYDLSKPEVRDKLRGRWCKSKDGEAEKLICRFYGFNNVFSVNGLTAVEFFENYVWLDGTPCGEEVVE